MSIARLDLGPESFLKHEKPMEKKSPFEKSTWLFQDLFYVRSFGFGGGGGFVPTQTLQLQTPNTPAPETPRAKRPKP